MTPPIFQRPQTRAAPLTAGLLAIAAAAVVALELAGVPTGWRVRLHSDPAREAMWLGQYGQTACVAFVALAIWLLDADGRRRAALLLITVLLAGGAASGMKVAAGRVRPHHPDAGRFLGPAAPATAANRSFPSGHTTAAFATSAMLAGFYPRGRKMFWSLAVACGGLRWTQDAHWLGDVLAGAAIGIAAADACRRVAERRDRTHAATVAPQPEPAGPTPVALAIPSRAGEGATGRTPFERARRVVSLAICVVLIAAILFRARPVETPAREAVEHAGFALLIVAAFGRAWAGLYLNGRKSRVLCRAGPYSLTRNPLYFFSLIGVIGFAMAVESYALPVVAAVLFVGYYHFVIAHEERRLRAAFGDDFAAYCRDVPRLFPRLRGYRDEPALSIRPRVFGRSLLDASVFVWAVVAIEVGETMAHAGMTSGVPSLWSIP